MKVTIADSLFMPYGRSAHGREDNLTVVPESVQWEAAPAQDARFVTELHMRAARGPGQVAWILEPFFLHPQNYTWLMENYQKFDYCLTHNANFSRTLGWLWHPFGGSSIRQEDWGIREKTKNVSMLLSAKNYQPGHILRHKIVEQYGDRFDDIFGLTPWEHKIDALAPYRYAVIVETERSPYYFSEKLIDCLAVGTIPIYWGCLHLGEFFDVDGILEFSNLDELESLLGWVRGVGPNLYAQRRESIQFNLHLARKFAVCEDWLFAHYPFLFGGHL